MWLLSYSWIYFCHGILLLISLRFIDILFEFVTIILIFLVHRISTPRILGMSVHLNLFHSFIRSLHFHIIIISSLIGFKKYIWYFYRTLLFIILSRCLFTQHIWRLFFNFRFLIIILLFAPIVNVIEFIKVLI